MLSPSISGLRRPSRFGLLSLCFSLLFFCKLTSASEEGDEENLFQEDDSHIEPAKAVLFPSFALTIGVLVFWLLSRYAQALPYTAIMFLIGTIMGLGAEYLGESENSVNQTIRQWININSEVLLLIFLPGLIFRDAFNQNTHLFLISLPQCIMFAFPMVLAGTSLTALFAFYVFPFAWSFNLCMVFGSILSATDPVAVAALLEQVGAPPRLKVHIAGEALLNDGACSYVVVLNVAYCCLQRMTLWSYVVEFVAGAAIVFFDIFKQRFLTELGEPDVGEDINLPAGVGLFFRKSLGAVAVGIFFGCGLLVLLYMLDRRFNREENVVEVTATITFAYLGYYVAEVVWETSGVLATVTCGVLVRFFGLTMIHDVKLLDDFWILVEHLLNTILFALGGVVWGALLARAEQENTIPAKTWGFLVLLYLALIAIRLFLFSSFYPVTRRIGLKTNWSETLFQVYGGLRGAVGIALAIVLDSEVREAIGEDTEDNESKIQTSTIFGFVGGIAFMTLTINGVTAGPLLKKMHLADATETRKSIVKAYRARFQREAIGDLVCLLTQPRFRNVNFAMVKHHVPYLKDLTRNHLMEAVERHKVTTPPEDYQPPYLQRILPYLPKEMEVLDVISPAAAGGGSELDEEKDEFDPELHAKKVKRALQTRNRMRRRSLSTMRVMMKGGTDPLSLMELRLLFLTLLKSAYALQMQEGELEDREFLAIALQSSLDFAADAVAKGEPLQDWDATHLVDRSAAALSKGFRTQLWVIRCVEAIWGKRSHSDVNYEVSRLRIERSLAFMAAHRWAQSFVQKEFENAECDLSEYGKVILDESRAQYRKANAVLEKFKAEEVETVVSHKFCIILLNKGVAYITKLVEYGLLKEQEGEHWVEEIEENIREVLSCNETDHPGEFSRKEEELSMSKLMETVEALEIES